MKTKQATGPNILERRMPSITKDCKDVATRETDGKGTLGPSTMSTLIVFCLDSKLIHVRRNLKKKIGLLF